MNASECERRGCEEPVGGEKRYGLCLRHCKEFIQEVADFHNNSFMPNGQILMGTDFIVSYLPGMPGHRGG